MVQYAAASRAARKLRQKAEAGGEHIPPFLIASITSLCNLHCKGCYARANHLCEEEITKRQMAREEWGSLFSQAEETGIGFILLAGGEPLLRRDVLEEAAVHKRILFPVFTNGTMLDASYEQLFSDHRNLVPVFSIEGERGRTDARRGDGVYKILSDSMERMKKAGILFGTSITVTKENIAEVTSCDFTEELDKAGCKAVIYVEYVPADGKTQELAPDDTDRAFMDKRLAELRSGIRRCWHTYPSRETRNHRAAVWRRAGDFSTSTRTEGQNRARFPRIQIQISGGKVCGKCCVPLCLRGFRPVGCWMQSTAAAVYCLDGSVKYRRCCNANKSCTFRGDTYDNERTDYRGSVDALCGKGISGNQCEEYCGCSGDQRQFSV